MGLEVPLILVFLGCLRLRGMRGNIGLHGHLRCRSTLRVIKCMPSSEARTPKNHSDYGLAAPQTS